MLRNRPESFSEQIGSVPVLTERRKLIIAGIVLALALVYLMQIAFQGSAVFYVTVGELLGRGEEAYGSTVRVSGKLVPGSFERTPGSAEASFAISEDDLALPSLYSGPIPELFFNEQSNIVLEGKYVGPDVGFQATNIIVKCPTKYEAAEVSL